MKTARTGMLEARAAGSKHCPEPKWHVASVCGLYEGEGGYEVVLWGFARVKDGAGAGFADSASAPVCLDLR